MKPFKLNLGVNDCSNENYHSDLNFLSSSVLKLIAKDPHQYYLDYICGGKVYESKPHLDLGSLTHTLVFEPQLLHEEYAFYPGIRRAGAEFEKFKAANPGKRLMLASQLQLAEAYARAVDARPELKVLLTGGHVEQSICAIIDDVPLKVRFDHINPETGIIVDLKTTRRNAGLSEFQADMKDWGYALSAGLYLKVAEHFYGRSFEYYYGVISKVDIIADLYKLSAKTRHEGTAQVLGAMQLYKQCKITGLWQAEKTTETSVQLEPEYEILEV